MEKSKSVLEGMIVLTFTQFFNETSPIQLANKLLEEQGAKIVYVEYKPPFQAQKEA